MSFSLLLLVGMLGLRAYSLASRHAKETSELLSRDLSAQSLLQKMSSTLSNLDSARRKLRALGDDSYGELVIRQESQLAIDSETLATIYDPVAPEIANEARAIRDETSLRKLRSALESRQQRKLRDSETDARGLLLLIAASATLSIFIALSLGALFFFGLIRPLRAIREATKRIREGDFEHRLRIDNGVTELRDLARAFNTMADRLGSLDRAKTEFLATVSHEIRNPLAALKEGLSLLTTQADRLQPATRDRSLRACLIASKRVESMIDNLLELSDGRLKLFDGEMSRRDLRDAVQTAMDEIRPLADRKKIGFRLLAPEAVEAAFNWSGLVHVCENLFQNAVKYGNEGSTVDVSAELDDSAAVVRVVNEGRPIPPSEASRIFDIFYRGSDAISNPRASGLGIGLNVVKRIIESHHGTVRASSENGRTCFEFRIPQQAAPAVAESLQTELKLGSPRRQLPVALLCLVVAALATTSGGCGTLYTIPGAPKKPPAPKVSAATAPQKESQLLELERQLWLTAPGGSVEVPAQVLKDLIDERNKLSARAMGLEQQLKALKVIDSEQTIQMHD